MVPTGSDDQIGRSGNHVSKLKEAATVWRKKEATTMTTAWQEKK